MKTKGVIFFVLFALLMLSAGYWLGQHSVVPARLAPATSRKVSSGMAKRSSLMSPAKNASTNQFGISKKTLLAGIEVKILEMKSFNEFQAGEFQTMIGSLEPTDFPELLACVSACVDYSIR